MEKTKANRMEANMVEARGSNEHENLWNKIKAERDVIEAAIKALVVLFLTIFGILTFKYASPETYNKILFDNWMVFLLICILSLGIILYAINTISPRSQKPKREKTFLSELREIFTHILALIITVPLIIASVCILLDGGTHSEGLTFISGLLGVIVGFYFGYRGVESAEKGKDEAIREAEKKKSEKEELDKKRIVEAKRAKSIIDEQTGKFAEVLNRYKKKEAWDFFKEEVKKEYKAKGLFEKVKNIDRYLPWEEEPEGGWSEVEIKLITKFEEEWELYAMDKSDLEEVSEMPPVMSGKNKR